MAKRVYFAFHYQDVIDFRANVVRNHNAFTGSQQAGYFDASIWEKAKKNSDIALKRMINSELKNTSATIVLIGSGTYARTWVQYEIFKSIDANNSLLGVHINSIKGKNGRSKVQGRNPFDYTGLKVSCDGKSGRATVWNGTKWVYFSKIAKPIPLSQRPPSERGKHFKLSRWIKTRDWVQNNGQKNFSSWI